MTSTKGHLTRRKIIVKSMHLFAAKGYFHTSIGDILEATGLTKGGLYGHFRSKEQIWYAAYEECTRVWKSIVLRGVWEVEDPVERCNRVIENSMRHYLGSGLFEGGCLLFNSLVEFSRQSSAIGTHILRGFQAFSRLIRSWLEEAQRQGLIDPGADPRAVADFIVVSINGTIPLYCASGDPDIWRQTITQLRFHLDRLRTKTGAPGTDERRSAIGHSRPDQQETNHG